MGKEYIATDKHTNPGKIISQGEDGLYHIYYPNNQSKTLTQEQMDIDVAGGYLKEYIKPAIQNRFDSDVFIDNVCLSYDHSFGLMNEKDKSYLRFQCKEWMRAIRNNWDHFKN